MLDQVTILGIVRHVLTFGGGYVVAKGWLTQPGLNEAIGALMTIAGIVWSVIEKKKRPA